MSAFRGACLRALRAKGGLRLALTIRDTNDANCLVLGYWIVAKLRNTLNALGRGQKRKHSPRLHPTSANCGVPNCPETALLFLLTSSCFYPWQDDAEKDGETERCLPVCSACSMNDEVPKQSHDDGNNQAYSKHSYKINE